jgi:hypothetical protein
MRVVNNKEIESIINLQGVKKYRYFINFVCDSEEVWGLYSDGWALAGDDKNIVFPLWPAKEFAEKVANEEWLSYTPESISISDLINDLLPKLKSDGVLCSILYTPNNKGIIIDPDTLKYDIDIELKKYS